MIGKDEKRTQNYEEGNVKAKGIMSLLMNNL